MTTELSPPEKSEIGNRKSEIPDWNSRVTTCDGLTGRISFVWRIQPSAFSLQPLFYFRVSFPPGSPYFDDWAVYRENEVTLLPTKPKE